MIDDKILERLESIDDTLKKLLDFFYSVEEYGIGDDPKYEEELKKDGFHPPIA